MGGVIMKRNNRGKRHQLSEMDLANSPHLPGEKHRKNECRCCCCCFCRAKQIPSQEGICSVTKCMPPSHPSIHYIIHYSPTHMHISHMYSIPISNHLKKQPKNIIFIYFLIHKLTNIYHMHTYVHRHINQNITTIEMKIFIPKLIDSYCTNCLIGLMWSPLYIHPSIHILHQPYLLTNIPSCHTSIHIINTATPPKERNGLQEETIG